MQRLSFITQKNRCWIAKKFSNYMNYLFIWMNIVRIINHNFRILIWYSSWHRIIFITKENKTISNFLINKKSCKASQRKKGGGNIKLKVFLRFATLTLLFSRATSIAGALGEDLNGQGEVDHDQQSLCFCNLR